MKDFIADLPFVGDFFEQKPKVVVLRLSGIIADQGARKGGISHAQFAQQIDKAFDMKDVREIALVINSPGGAPAQCSLIASQIRNRAREKKIPVTAFVEDVAASGGYWLACAADKIFVQESSIVGSIGVISASFGFEEFIRRFDIKRRVHAAGAQKSFMDPFVPEKKSDIERLRAIQDDIHDQFKGWVKKRRKERLTGDEKDYFEGQIWTGRAAIYNGIADGIGDLRSVMRDKYGEKVRLIHLEADKPFIQSLLGIKGGGVAGEFTGELTGGITEGIAGGIENRSAWGRYGL